MKAIKYNFELNVALIPLVILVLFATFQASITVFAADENTHKATPGVVVEELLQAHNASSIDALDCATVSSNEWNVLGESVMQLMFGNNVAQHEFMDKMMGGDGSPSLTAMHERIGRMYLNCSEDDFGAGMMMGGMMNLAGRGTSEWGGLMQIWQPEKQMSTFNNNNIFDSMMGFDTFGFGWVGSIIMIAFLGLLIAGIVILVQKLLGRDSNVQCNHHRDDESALDILKIRYAKGEIDKKEYEEKKKVLANKE